ncbi:MAG: hypothetical protein ABJH63_00235 [Rhizobiaceae bacterium]
MSTNLHVSANQWRMSILKACIGAHVARGVAEDIADAGLALLALQHDPLPSVLACLNNHQSHTSTVTWPNGSDKVEFGQMHVLHHGPSVIDLAQSGTTISCQIDAPDLLLGLAQARLHSHGVTLHCNFDDDDWRTPTIALQQINAATSSRPFSLRLSQTDEPVAMNMTQLPQPSRENWCELQDFTAEILVPADATSREDAGVGDGQTDND